MWFYYLVLSVKILCCIIEGMLIGEGAASIYHKRFHDHENKKFDWLAFLVLIGIALFAIFGADLDASKFKP